MSNGITLAALRLDESGEWQGHAAERLSVPDWSAEVVRAQVRVFPNDVTGDLPSGAQYRDGFHLGRLWLAPRRWAVAIRPQRKWFTTTGEPDPRPEDQILGGRMTPKPDLKYRVSCLRSILDALAGLPGIGDGPIQLVGVHEDLHQLASIRVGDRTVPCDARLNSLFKDLGFHSVPQPTHFDVVPIQGTRPAAAPEYVSQLQRTLQARRCAASVAVGRVDDIGQSPDHTILFLLPGDKDQAPSGEALSAFSAADAQGIPWRRAFETDDFRFSVPTQVCSLIQAAGGKPFAVETVSGRHLPWSLGIDLSHPTNARESQLCGALIDPTGNLVHSWVQEHPHDETIRAAQLRVLLGAAVDSIPSSERDRGLLVMRDGRLFEKENYRQYKEDLGTSITLVEMRKGGAAPLLVGSDQNLPRVPVFGVIPSDSRRNTTACIVTMPGAANGRFGRVLKVFWRQEWNGLDLTSDDMAAILIALARAPSLGDKQHILPAPIYWADGIASAGDDALKFRGQSVTSL